MKKLFFFIALFTMIYAEPPIYIAFLWHMHQPVYYPGEDVMQSAAAGHYSYNLLDVFNSRFGPYTSWPANGVTKGINAGLEQFGAQVSFSGSLVRNLNRLESAGNTNFTNWKSHWNGIKTRNTASGNPRIDMVAFGEFHPLMPLTQYRDIRDQIQMHKQTFTANFNGTYSRGIFPPENAFALHMIPALLDEGLEWVLVDNVHMERCCENYPYNTAGGLYEPNRADVRNPDPGDWKQLNNLWAPTQVSAAWAHRPHYAEYIDPETGESRKMIVVPASRYLGNEDGRGGFGALLYEDVMSQLESHNTDPEHPVLVVLHHDGDNYGGGTDSYYGSNFENFVNWLQSNSQRFVCTTIQDYLDKFPPDPGDIVHVEPGSWSGADNGDPQFRKWLGEPGSDGYSPDRNSWGVLTAAQNILRTAEQMDPDNALLDEARQYLAMAQTSCYWYWDGSEGGLWDSHPTRAANLALANLNTIISSGSDQTAPEIFLPQRDPYNPGATEFTLAQTSDMRVWTYVYDQAGLSRIELKYREDHDGYNNPQSIDNETYAGGSEAGDWQSIPMSGKSITSRTNPLPLFKAMEYTAQVTNKNNVLLDYYIEAEDLHGNVARSVIQHVWIGEYNGGGSSGSGLSWSPLNPAPDDSITISIEGAGMGATLHWGVNQWQQPIPAYRPAGSALWSDNVAVRTPMQGPESNVLSVKIGPFNDPAQAVTTVDFVIHYEDNSWDNNSGGDYHIDIREPVTGTQSAGPVQLRVFPNPGKNLMSLQYSGTEIGGALLNVYDLSGRCVLQRNISGPQQTLDIRSLPQGMYIMTLTRPGTAELLKMKYVKL
ncbi:MAG: T9SS type A sorting domain-containing protein [Candidatus Neomarinimicrobiota bacterium]|jgi:hypothetical protein|nr:T9SS type A sorting domain-containing protein [Candidatus Neomarinimicrobiota bacterium]MDD3966198.1 T9SS type A sorting domain-containing protein [Candidatus Neomarinimicrobiota bacterium]